MGHLRGLENMMREICGVRLSRKLLDDEGEEVVLRVAVFPRGTGREAQRTIAKRLDLFFCRIGRAFTFVEVFPFVLGEPGRVRQKVMDRHSLPGWRGLRVVLADGILDTQFAAVG